jgi:hypothetical protein
MEIHTVLLWVTVGVAVVVTVYGVEGDGTDRHPHAALIADGE